MYVISISEFQRLYTTTTGCNYVAIILIPKRFTDKMVFFHSSTYSTIWTISVRMDFICLAQLNILLYYK